MKLGIHQRSVPSCKARSEALKSKYIVKNGFSVCVSVCLCVCHHNLLHGYLMDLQTVFGFEFTMVWRVATAGSLLDLTSG